MSEEKRTEKNVSVAVIKRLPKYYRYLGEVLDMDITRISSKELSLRMNITASQIRQDLNNFGSFGLQGYGYNVELLYNEIGRILDLVKKHTLVVVGAGNIGQALANYSRFTSRGFEVVAIFDKSESIVGKEVNGLIVQDVKNLGVYLASNEINMVVLTIPKQAVESVIDVLNNSDIEGVWNFTNMDISLRKGIRVENVNLMDSLMTLSYKINEDDIIKRYSCSKNIKEQYYKQINSEDENF